jgi:uncharacterized membrane protein YedE/YeeE
MSPQVRESAWAFACGIVFGLGLVVAGMTDPANIQGFLDITGAWRPQLAAVMGGGVIVTGLLYAIARSRARPLVAATFQWPQRGDIDGPLVAGAAIFGAGWALTGYCPGPAITSLGTLAAEAWVFVPAMAAGVWAARRVSTRK